MRLARVALWGSLVMLLSPLGMFVGRVPGTAQPCHIDREVEMDWRRCTNHCPNESSYAIDKPPSANNLGKGKYNT